MVLKGAVEESQSPYFVSPIFVVTKKSGGMRPIIYLKKLNRFLHIEHFKLENLCLIRELLNANMWLAKIDLEDAYYSVTIHSEDRKFLQFRWQGKLYQYCSLPVGLATAPFVFTKLLKPVVAFLRAQGLRLIRYLDDMLLMSSLQEDLSEELTLCANTLTWCGYTINTKKSMFTPVQEIEFLGVLINSKNMTLGTPLDKREKVTQLAQHLLNAEVVKLREIARF
ncbi:unnamed protein product, partial [Allacma fusca]